MQGRCTVDEHTSGVVRLQPYLMMIRGLELLLVALQTLQPVLYELPCADSTSPCAMPDNSHPLHVTH